MANVYLAIEDAEQVTSLKAALEKAEAALEKASADSKTQIDQYDALVVIRHESQATFLGAVRVILSHALWPHECPLNRATVGPLLQTFEIQGVFQVEKAFVVPDEPKFAHIFYDTVVE